TNIRTRERDVKTITITDGLPDDHPCSGDRILDVFEGMRTMTGPVFKEMMECECVLLRLLYQMECFLLWLMWRKRLGYRAHGLILNTFQGLDESILVHMQTLCPNIYCIGPIHTLYNSRVTNEPKVTTQTPQSIVSNSLWEENPFLWVQRPGSIIGEYDVNQVPKHLADETKQRGFITTWVPQEAVLAHTAIGVFLTHSGWNSTIESIMEGVPMICWPQNVDQQVNSRFVSEVWKIGIDIKDTCDRAIVEKAVRDVIDARRSEFIESTRMLGELGGQSVADDGASVMDLYRLIKTISSL
ncbi:hypothetical protein M8C21_021660, partial [Ambrosia artemisiifolia]